MKTNFETYTNLFFKTVAPQLKLINDLLLIASTSSQPGGKPGVSCCQISRANVSLFN